jgi:tripartite-type tricarboxylate transporter receptor subunit TctC
MTRSRVVIAPKRRVLTVAVLAAGILASVPFVAQAQAAFPARALTIVVPFSAGGTTDILARVVGQYLSKDLGQPVIIDNRPGAGGNIGAQMVARAAPDGYTLLMGTVGTHAINQSLYKKMPFDPIKDFQPLTRVALVPNLLVAHPSQPYKTVKELIAYAKANPGKVNFASSGSGTSIHLSAEMFNQMAGVDMQHIPYKGSAPALNDLLGGQTAIMFDNMPSVIGHVRAGKLRPIAVTTPQRSRALPDVPTIAESGVPGYSATSWFGLLADIAAGAGGGEAERVHFESAGRSGSEEEIRRTGRRAAWREAGTVCRVHSQRDGEVGADGQGVGGDGGLIFRR